jgi:ribosomal protein L11 methylase PrmA
VTVDPASFRDPSGFVLDHKGRILRLLTKAGLTKFETLQSTGLLDSLVASGLLVEARRVHQPSATDIDPNGAAVLEHARLPFVSYPYEWSFSHLKAAALCFLELSIECLRHDVILADASAYNVQFVGSKPIFIDHLSFASYREGQFWEGYRQFCEQFLNPLLLQSFTSVPFNKRYRGGIDGIPSSELAAFLPWRSFLDWRALVHVHLSGNLQHRSSSIASESVSSLRQRVHLTKRSYLQLLETMRLWVERLSSKGPTQQQWVKYNTTRSYPEEGLEIKSRFIAKFVATERPDMVWDLGCNVGEYSVLALRSGAKRCVGFDSDSFAIDVAMQASRHTGLEFLPLVMDFNDPSTNLGWRERERKGLMARSNADAILVLALIHHLVISKNIPLAHALDWLMCFAPCGVLEFVPKSDPMVKKLLALREDIFPDYTLDSFKTLLSARAQIIEAVDVPGTDRAIYWYRRNPL